jgi:hypothetical protein
MFDATTEYYGEGWVDPLGTVREFVNHTYNTSTGIGQVNFSAGPGSMQVNILSGSLNIPAGVSLHLDKAALFDIGGVNQGRGFVTQVVYTSNIVTGAVSGTEYAGYVLPVATFLNGHAYMLRVPWGKIRSAAAQQPTIGIRTWTGSAPVEGNAYSGGTLLVSGPQHPITSTSIDLPFQPTPVFINTSGSDQVVGLTVTIKPNSATAVQLSAGAGNLAVLADVVDIGAASDWTGMPSL